MSSPNQQVLAVIAVIVLLAVLAGAVYILQQQAKESELAAEQVLNDRAELIGLQVSYELYCTTVKGKPQAACADWSTQLAFEYSTAARDCSIHSYRTAVDLLESCLTSQGVSLP